MNILIILYLMSIGVELTFIITGLLQLYSQTHTHKIFFVFPGVQEQEVL